MSTFAHTESYIHKSVIKNARYYERFKEPYCVRWRGKSVCADGTDTLVEKLILIEQQLGEE